MKHDEWVKKMKAATALEHTDPDGALDALKKLAEESHEASKDAMSTWHEEQTLGYAALICEQLGRHEDACALEDRVADVHRGNLVYAGMARANSLVRKALLQFRMGRGDEGERLTKEALALFGQFPEPNVFLADAIREWRKHVDKKHSSFADDRHPSTEHLKGKSRAIELHDSVIKSSRTEGAKLVLEIDTYMHVSVGEPGVDAGTGWTQPARLMIEDAQVLNQPPEGKLTISEGAIRVGQELHENMVPFPLLEDGDIRIELTGAEGSWRITGSAVWLVPTGEAVLVEEFGGTSK